MKVEVVPYNPQWKQEFNSESQKIQKILADNVVIIHHIGSTAIPNIYAKPVIDFLIEVKNINLISQQTLAMEKLGYEAMGEFGLVGRRYFRKENPSGIRTHHVHIYQTNSPEIKRHLAFRDYMLAHTQDAEQYSQLKQELARKYPNDIESYMDSKDEFVKRMEKKAIQWQDLMN